MKRKQRWYGLFVRVNNRWVRETYEWDGKQVPFSPVRGREAAARRFQNRLLDGALGAGPERCIKPVEIPAF